MAKIHFRPYTPNQTVLFPQRIDEDIAENDPIRSQLEISFSPTGNFFFSNWRKMFPLAVKLMAAFV